MNCYQLGKVVNISNTFTCIPKFDLIGFKLILFNLRPIFSFHVLYFSNITSGSEKGGSKYKSFKF